MTMRTHIYKKSSTNTPVVGDSVKLVNQELQKTTDEKDRLCIGVYYGQEFQALDGDQSMFDDFRNEYTFSDYGTDPTFGKVISSGCPRKGNAISGAKLCDEDGAISAGDLLCTANKDGFLKKQTTDGTTYDNVIRDYTVAQAIEDVTFDENGNTEASGVYVYLLK